jgi:hypothetical protein
MKSIGGTAFQPVRGKIFQPQLAKELVGSAHPTLIGALPEREGPFGLSSSSKRRMMREVLFLLITDH